MPQLLALEWNSTEARVVLASRRGGQLAVERAFLVPLASGQPGAENVVEDVGKQIAAALAAKGIGPMDALLGLGRASFELRQLQLPVAPDEELPEIVHLQAMREFNDLDDQWLLDFVPIDPPSGDSQNVLLAVVRPEQVRQIKDVCQAAGLKMKCLVPRAFAAAALVDQAGAARPAQSRLLIEILADETNLTATIDGKVVFLRSTRLSGAAAAGGSLDANLLLSETRRTMAAVGNQWGRKIESIVLCGRGEPFAELASRIQQDLQTATELFDPFAGLNCPAPEHPERFAPLLGMLLAEGEPGARARSASTLDFLHPRRRPAPPNRRRTFTIAGAAVALLVAAYLIYSRVESGWLAEEVRDLQQQSQALDQRVTQAETIRATATDIGKWAETDVVWLDALRGLCQALPAADSAILRQLTFGPSPGGGEIRLRGFTQKSAIIAALEDAMRKRARHVVDHESHEDHSLRGYDWQFDTSVIIGRESP